MPITKLFIAVAFMVGVQFACVDACGRDLDIVPKSNNTYFVPKSNITYWQLFGGASCPEDEKLDCPEGQFCYLCGNTNCMRCLPKREKGQPCGDCYEHEGSFMCKSNICKEVGGSDICQ